MQGRFGEFFRQRRRVAVTLRQLIGTEKEVSQAETDIGSQHMGLQLHAQARQYFGRNRAGGNRITRPGQHRRSKQQDVLAGLSRSRHRMVAALGTGFHHVGQFVIGAPARPIQMIERGIQRGLIVGRQQAIDQARQAALPKIILQATAGKAQLGGNADQILGIGGLFAATGKAGTFHGNQQESVQWQHAWLPGADSSSSCMGNFVRRRS